MEGWQHWIFRQAREDKVGIRDPLDFLVLLVMMVPLPVLFPQAAIAKTWDQFRNGARRVLPQHRHPLAMVPAEIREQRSSFRYLEVTPIAARRIALTNYINQLLQPRDRGVDRLRWRGRHFGN
jgi:hypothetical protein